MVLELPPLDELVLLFTLPVKVIGLVRGSHVPHVVLMHVQLVASTRGAQLLPNISHSLQLRTCDNSAPLCNSN